MSHDGGIGIFQSQNNLGASVGEDGWMKIP
jgi:hypothetical protein